MTRAIKRILYNGMNAVVFTALSCSVLTVTARAEPAPHPGSWDGPPGAFAPPEGAAPQPPHPPPPTDSWLEWMRQKDPDEFERLTRMRRNRPDAFVSELQHRLQIKRLRHCLQQYPQLYEAFTNLPPNEREQLRETLFPAPPHRRGPPRRGRQPRPDSHGPGSEPTEIKRLQIEALALAHQYQAAENEEERKALHETLEQTITQIFELRSDNQRQAIEKLTLQLKGLNDRLNARDEQKEQIIERNLRRLIGTPQDGPLPNEGTPQSGVGSETLPDAPL